MLLNPSMHDHMRFKRLDVSQVITEPGWVPLTLKDINALYKQFPIFLNPCYPDDPPVVHVMPSDCEAPLGGSIPNMWQGYPFALTGVTEGFDNLSDIPRVGNNLALSADLNSPHFHSGGGYRVFEPNGGFTPVVEKIIEQLKTAFAEWQADRVGYFTQLLERAGVIIEAEVSLGHGLRYRMPLIDPQRLQARKAWLESQEGGLTAILLAEQLVYSQSHLKNMRPAGPYSYTQLGLRSPVPELGRNRGLCLPYLQPKPHNHTLDQSKRHSFEETAGSWPMPVLHSVNWS